MPVWPASPGVGFVRGGRLRPPRFLSALLRWMVWVGGPLLDWGGAIWA
jgi:hypothetical protein